MREEGGGGGAREELRKRKSEMKDMSRCLANGGIV